MDALTPLAVQAIAGLLGGGIAGNLIDTAAIRTSPKVLLGLLGGVAGGALAALALGTGQVALVAPDPGVTADVTSRVDFAALGAWAGGGLIGGGLMTTVAGALGFGR
jgi:hypothetical protein